MKFLVDAQLPRALCLLLQSAGHDAIHTSQLSAGNATTDEVINELSLRDQRVVVTKDTDFYHSHLTQGKPWKLLLIRTGNIRTAQLKRLLQDHLPRVMEGLRDNSIVELHRDTVQIIM
jgi:predicted nuclease of predicted toxin-antitoxin system